MKRRLFAILMIVTLFSFPSSAKLSITESDEFSLLTQHGYPVEVINAMDPKFRDSLINTLSVHPEKIQTTKVTMRFNLADDVARVMATPDEDFIAAGMSQEQISRIRSEASFLQNSSLARGEITTSEMDFWVTVEDVSNATIPVKYNVSVSFIWSTPFLVDLYDDIIAVAWGGDLFESNISEGTVAYYGFSKPSTWNSYVTSTSMTLAKEEPNKGLQMEFSQQYNLIAQPKLGSFSFTLSRNNEAGENTYIIAQYGHRTLAIGDLGIGLDGTPSISIGSAYDTTSIEEGRVRITY